MGKLGWGANLLPKGNVMIYNVFEHRMDKVKDNDGIHSKDHFIAFNGDVKYQTVI